ncbi:TIGR04282 family arsenosugar biosynthesis glycosyltransferase [Nonlabens sp.]|uniref:TIGR04282 family arsenosugar biosynthesis glycosyltransferase n=1 Tax=Nonlabens sp. TaxID=1888209 RepID=UPI003F69B064
MSNCLIIFTRNPELGKGKRRLAATVGDQVAFDIYKFLLAHTREITRDLKAVKQVWYSERLHLDDDWDNAIYDKQVQAGDDLGERMNYAFAKAMQQHSKVIIIGSDLHDLEQQDLEKAFELLDHHDAVIGPATDGGYYLLGFKNHVPQEVFQNKIWGTDTVLENTIKDLETLNYATLAPRNDVDYYEDIKDVHAFQPYLKDINVK